MPPISLQELYQIKNKQRQKQKQRFQKVIELVHSRIRAAAKQDKMSCSYEIPIFLPGMPLYDRMECLEYVMDNLKTSGFHVTKRGPNPWELFISWDPDHVNTPGPGPSGPGPGPGGPMPGAVAGPAPEKKPRTFVSFLS